MDNIWTQQYDPGVPHTIDTSRYNTLIDLIDEAFLQYANQPCVVSFGTTLTYHKIAKLSDAFAGYLQKKCQLQKGERIAMMMPNILQYPVALFGALKAGLIVSNLNPLCNETEIHKMLLETDAKCVVVFEGLAHVLQKAIQGTQVNHVIIARMGDLMGLIKGPFFNYMLKRRKDYKPWSIPNAVMFNSTIKPHYFNDFVKPTIHSDDVAFLQYTDAREFNYPKCVMLTHRNVVSNILQISEYISDLFKNPIDLYVLNLLPLYHVFSLIGNLFIFMRHGFLNILVINPFDIPVVVKLYRKYKISVLLGLNPLFNALAHDNAFKKLDFSTLKLVAGGGAMKGKVIRQWKALTGAMILEGYGSSETTLCVTLNPLSIKKYNTSSGLPLPSTEIKICNEEGSELPIGMIGELWIKGPQLMKGYWKNSSLTIAQMMDDGWYRSGDMASVNSKGYLRIIDRKSDAIIINNNIVYPHEIDDVIAGIKGISDVAIVSTSSSSGNQKMVAFVVKNDPTITPEMILSHCQQNLPDYKIPHEIVFRSSLPKSYVGNILRRVLREEANSLYNK